MIRGASTYADLLFPFLGERWPFLFTAAFGTDAFVPTRVRRLREHCLEANNRSHGPPSSQRANDFTLG